MDRMTYVHDGRWCISGTAGKVTSDNHANYWGEAIDYLAAYEDTGLTPEEVKDMAENAETRLLTWFESRYGFPVGKLMDFCEAEQQRRLVVLPCKVGDTVYRVCKKKYDVDGYGMQWHEDWGVVLERFRFGLLNELGKTVFLSREEAEAALRGGAE